MSNIESDNPNFSWLKNSKLEIFLHYLKIVLSLKVCKQKSDYISYV